jgi:hypothetical protein
MFTIEEVRALLNAQPFVPFRLHLTDGGWIEVRHREQVFLTRRLAVIGIPDPNTHDSLADRFAIVGYMHISRAELLDAGSPPFASPPTGQAGSPSGVTS